MILSDSGDRERMPCSSSPHDEQICPTEKRVARAADSQFDRLPPTASETATGVIFSSAIVIGATLSFKGRFSAVDLFTMSQV